MKVPIWFNKEINLADTAVISLNTMSNYLDMKLSEIGHDFLKMSMPVSERTRQPYGLLHGGASCALAETAGSVASQFVIDSNLYHCVGLEINANHLKAVKEGLITATASALHLGSGTHVWDIRIHDDQSRLICIARLTVAILKKKG